MKSINIFGKPKKLTEEQWVETLTNVIANIYNFDDELERVIIKTGLTRASEAGPLTVTSIRKAFCDMYNEAAMSDGNSFAPTVIIDEIRTIVLPEYMFKSSWIELFTDINGKELVSLSPKGLIAAKKECYDRIFADFITDIWLAYNLPTVYEQNNNIFPPSPRR